MGRPIFDSNCSPRMNKLCLLYIILLLSFLHACSKSNYTEITEANGLSITVSSNTQTDTENQLFDLINEHRISMGLNELEFESTSYYFAKKHTDYMISQGKTSHDNFTWRAENISTETGAVKVSENVAKDYDSPEVAMTAWLNSPEHRKNLEGNYSHSALSIKANASGDLYFTQIFIR